MKLSERLEARLALRGHPSEIAKDPIFVDSMECRRLLKEAAELARRVEDAPKFTAERVTAAGMTWVGVDVTGHVEYGQRVRLVPEAGLGGGS